MRVDSLPVRFTVRSAPTDDWIARYLADHPLAPGEWSEAVEGMGGLNAYHDPDARSGGTSINNAQIDGNVITTARPHTILVGDTVLVLGSSLNGEVAHVTSVTENTLVIDGYADAPSEVNLRLFPDYYTRTVPFEDESGGGFLDWNAHFYYDPVTGLHTVGGGVGSSGGYTDSPYKTWRIRYDPRTNRWYKRWNPLGRGGAHHYSSNAMDTGSRTYYRGLWAMSLDDDTAPAVLREGSPRDTSVAAAFCCHEHLVRFYRITSGGRLCFWHAETGWSEEQIVSGLGNHPIATYSSASRTMVFGGGNPPARAFYKIDASGAIASLDDVPASRMPLNAGGSVSTMLIDVGFPDRLLVLQDDYESGVGNPRPGIGWLLPNAPSGTQWRESPDRLPAVLAEYGGSKREIAACGIRHLGVVMVMRHWAGGSLDAAAPAGRRCAVWFYRPSPA